MADILIRGLSIPKEGFINLSVQSEGLTMLTGTSAFNEKTGWFEWQKCEHTMHETIELSEHGDLISADDVQHVLDNLLKRTDDDAGIAFLKWAKDCVRVLPKIVPSNKEDTE